ncbi:MAG: hypothetical protein IM571_03025 [Chitinophagaceae bacterium]|jgi:hypothetical protein|nr:hypothetical protein [Chitinophagaceae bacterium]MCA6476906.1 hypothetical protein [Chitinophagaceae bacterium]MCA6514570.1 hypothetical protein [Chitinophagaceae bacterium]MCE2972680.1 hypothetical protein [Sediminibacterium sp.]
MEVHHHTHHPKKWKEYFWEFFMLFLAVFCGFLAEIQVEHYIEHQREKKYIYTLLEDLQRDLDDFDNDLPDWQEAIQMVDTLRAELEKPSQLMNHALIYRLSNNLTYNNTFFYHDRTISQLKNGGNFRLIRKKDIADTLIEYDASIIYGLKDVEQFYTNNIFPQLRSLRNQFLSSKFYYLLKNDTAFAAAINREPEVILFKPGEEKALFQYYNTLYELRQNTMLRIKVIKRQQRQAVSMISMIKRDYSIE